MDSTEDVDCRQFLIFAYQELFYCELEFYPMRHNYVSVIFKHLGEITANVQGRFKFCINLTCQQCPRSMTISTRCGANLNFYLGCCQNDELVVTVEISDTF